jgi:hypothetical protein
LSGLAVQTPVSALSPEASTGIAIEPELFAVCESCISSMPLVRLWEI